MTKTNDPSNELIHEIGEMIATDREFLDRDWDSPSLVFKLKDGQRSVHGYKYGGDEHWTPASIDDFAILHRVVDLRTAMAGRPSEPWNWCLLTIVAPDMKIALDFSHEEKNPWGLETKSLDLHDYAMSLRSPGHPSGAA